MRSHTSLACLCAGTVILTSVPVLPLPSDPAEIAFAMVCTLTSLMVPIYREARLRGG